ncbi:hypothetical protein TNCV_2653831 [Trichonephila clavipes]|nr:hypothetical protein TNCV_2653831 [Trichonephila clavipes]
MDPSTPTPAMSSPQDLFKNRVFQDGRGVIVTTDAALVETWACVVVPQKTFRVMKSAELKCRPRHLTMIQISVFNSPRVVSNYTRPLGDGPPHFEPWSSDEDDT